MRDGLVHSREAHVVLKSNMFFISIFIAVFFCEGVFDIFYLYFFIVKHKTAIVHPYKILNTVCSTYTPFFL